MNQPFEAAGDHFINNWSIIVDGGRFAGIGLGLPEEFGKEAQEKADLLERRLSRLEKALGLDPICDG
ncbi:hypothetical protein [Pseudomonas sp. MRSN 12121]|uniref:hypothetical protein n=1 Tax=Pseudomonas sp. MRSN 12121 TaxID=1611770 RepID=UPI0005BEA258|nr:hypothetical protein [Pseudomonas sp. MRSN 12121]AJO76501.1 hypothetical protein TO66_04060 [Pseudomonas sp. MRSN 12121]AJO77801.1 hypothetical protein TO66_11030 [Pseudomonas sp. MRSN 12121]